MNEADINLKKPAKREAKLSSDGKWKSFSKVPNLIQYVTTGTFYGRIKVGGKTIRRSLETTVWSIAKERVRDFLTENQNALDAIEVPTFSEAVELFRQLRQTDLSLKQTSREYTERCLTKIARTWEGLDGRRLNGVTLVECREWASRLKALVADQYFNNIIDVLRQVFAVGIKVHVKRGGKAFENPAKEIPKVRVKAKELRLPEAEHFKALLENIQMKSGGWGPRVADSIRFLAFSGLRIKSEAYWVTWEDVDWNRKELIVRGDPKTSTKNGEMRRVPLLPDMEALLTNLKADAGGNPSGTILPTKRCDESLTRACKTLGIPRLTHHDLRHLFATRCIESGVDIPTVSRWLGHKDGGALAMKVYGHLRNQHSQEMAKKVRF